MHVKPLSRLAPEAQVTVTYEVTVT